MEKSAILHVSEGNYAYPIDISVLNVRLRTKKDDFSSVKVFYKDLYDHTELIQAEEMKKIHSDDEIDLYEASIGLKNRHFKYYFQLTDGKETVSYCADGFLPTPVETNFFYYPMINRDDLCTPPVWAEGEIIYQLLVDRFFDGDPKNNPPVIKKWRDLPDRNTYYGGDFAGIEQKMDYLSSLGVKSIYLSPVFQSPSYHKYDISDYDQIEEIYGGKSGLKSLVNSAHSRGMKILLDGVFNHCSSQHPFFQDLLTNQKKSRYVRWFEPYEFPVSIEKANYNNFANLVPKMPRWDTTNPEVITYLTDSALRWTEELGIDGWRLDVADEVSSVFWRTFRRKLKAVNPDILIIGEIWNTAGRWMAGDQMDTMTNYKYRKLVLQWMAGTINSVQFFALLSQNKMLYKTPLHPYLINLIGSHDTERIRHAADCNNAILAMSLTLLLDGVPLIYYGDECGLDGGKDPDNRRAMDWSLTLTKEAESIRRLALFRSHSDCLKKGSVTPLHSSGKVLAFQRKYKDEEYSVIVNFEPIPVRTEFTADQLLFGDAEQKDGFYQVKENSFAIFSSR